MIRLNTSMGIIDIELDYENAPKSAENFEQYVKDGFYDGTIFHRVIKGFMVQGGGMEPGMSQKQTRSPIENEANNNLKNDIGTVAMARTNDPHSASSQFFINLTNNDFLNFSSPTGSGWGYCVFGKVVNGMDVVDKIKEQPTGNSAGHDDVPVDDITIDSATIVD
jgi:peptidyl-prolyl cis-trans isomerase B (cyclophilin B)